MVFLLGYHHENYHRHSVLQVAPELNQLLETLTAEESTDSITINFRDEEYAVETGGFHPVEIGIRDGAIEYITDFCYVGMGQEVELVKEIDFDFTNQVFGHLYSPDRPIAEGSDLFEIWQENYLAFVDMEVFTVTITTD